MLVSVNTNEAKGLGEKVEDEDEEDEGTIRNVRRCLPTQSGYPRTQDVDLPILHIVVIVVGVTARGKPRAV